MKLEIKHRWNGSVLFSFEASSVKVALEAAVKSGAYLKGADLKGAYLEGAYLEGADLEGADLEGADLEGAYLEGADLEGADLEGAYLKGADLEGAYLEGPKEDFWKVLDAAPQEVPGLRKAMVDGKIDGSTYCGECACLVGTIARVKGCDSTAIPGLKRDSSRPAETWFMMFRPGHTPKNHGGMKVTLKWLDEWTAKQKVKQAA